MKKLICILLVLILTLTGCDLVDRVKNMIQGTTGDIGSTDDPADTPTDESGDKPTGDLTEKPECTKHTDADDNGICDDCSVSVIVIIDFYAVNDLHGKIVKSDSQPGIGGLTSYLKKVSGENTVLISSGDMWQGSSESNLTHGALITDWMTELGFVSMTLGNHEYDWSDEYIYSNLENADFPFLAINVYDKTTGERADYATPSVIVERGGIEIGIIGAIGDCYSSISGEVVGDVEFKVGDELTELVKDESERLKALGVEFIVYSIHDGYGKSSGSKRYVSDSQIASYYDVELSGDYVDLVFEAHTHQSYILVDSEGVYHLQGGGENGGISYAKLRYNTANGNSHVGSAELIRSSVYGGMASDPLIDELLLKYRDDVDGVYDVIGHNSRYRDDSEVEQIVADLYYRAGIEKWGAEYDIILGGGFIRTRNPYNLGSGDITYSDLYSLLPFDNELVLCSIKGSDLLRKFVGTSNTDYYISYGENDISSIDQDKTYYVVVDTYTSSYVYNNLTEVARFGSGVYARDLFAEYVKSGGLE